MAFETSDDRRHQTPIARRKLTLTSIVSESEAEVIISMCGELLQYVIVAPNLSTDTDFDFVIRNEDSETLYSNTGISDNGSTLVLLSATPVPMSGSLNFSVDFTTNQISTWSIYLYYR